MNTTTNQEVAKEILNQLGGGKFIGMTGANSFAARENSLSFRICRNPGHFKGVEITLNGLDLYDLKFYRQKNAPSFEVTCEEVNGVYAEDLRAIFTNKTGLIVDIYRIALIEINGELDLRKIRKEGRNESV